MHGSIIRFRTSGNINLLDTVESFVKSAAEPVTALDITTEINLQLPEDARLRKSQVSHQLSKADYYGVIIRTARGHYFHGKSIWIPLYKDFPWLFTDEWWVDGTIEDVIRDLIGWLDDHGRLPHHKAKIWGWYPVPGQSSVPNFSRVSLTRVTVVNFTALQS